MGNLWKSSTYFGFFSFLEKKICPYVLTSYFFYKRIASDWNRIEYKIYISNDYKFSTLKKKKKIGYFFKNGWFFFVYSCIDLKKLYIGRKSNIIIQTTIIAQILEIFDSLFFVLLFYIFFWFLNYVLMQKKPFTLFILANHSKISSSWRDARYWLQLCITILWSKCDFSYKNSCRASRHW